MTATISFLKGKMATASGFNANNSVLGMHGMTTPCTFGVTSGSTELLVTRHAGMFGSGVTLIEDAPRYVNTANYFNIGMNNYDGTVLYRLDNGLNFTPTLSIEPGHIGVHDDANVLVVGWISYPGNNESLSASHFYPAQLARLFAYSSFFNVRDILGSIPVRLDPPSLQQIDQWYAAGSPNFTLKLCVDNITTNTVVSDSVVNDEHWLVFNNTGSTTQKFVIEVIPNNNDDPATSLHTRISMDVGVVINTGIQYRGSQGERALKSGTISGPVSAGTFLVSLIETTTPKRQAFRLRYNVTLPGGKKFSLASIGVGNDNFFGSMFEPD